MKTVKNINLLLKVSRFSDRTYRLGRYLALFSVILLVLFLITYMLSFTYLSYATVKNKTIQIQIEDLFKKVNQIRDLEAIEVASVTKIKAIDEINSKQPPYPTMLMDFQALPHDGILFKALNIDPMGSVKIDLIASSSGVLKTFVEDLTRKDEIDKKYANIKSNGISRDKDGGYIMSIMFVVNTDKFHE